MIYFFVYLFLEVMISSTISGSIGGLNTFFEILLTAVIGISILKNFKHSLMESITKARSGKITQEEFIKANVGKAIGAVLLIIPGFFTDIIGVMLQFGFLVIIFSKIFKFKPPIDPTSTRHPNNFEYDYSKYNNTNYKGKDDEIIDVEIVDSNNTIKH